MNSCPPGENAAQLVGGILFCFLLRTYYGGCKAPCPDPPRPDASLAVARSPLLSALSPQDLAGSLNTVGVFKSPFWRSRRRREREGGAEKGRGGGGRGRRGEGGRLQERLPGATLATCPVVWPLFPLSLWWALERLSPRTHSWALQASCLTVLRSCLNLSCSTCTQHLVWWATSFPQLTLPPAGPAAAWQHPRPSEVTTESHQHQHSLW